MSREGTQPVEEAHAEPRARGVVFVRWWQALLSGLAHAALMTLAFPPVSLWGVAFVAALPLAWLAWRTPRPLWHGVLALAGTLPFYAFQLSYIATITGAGFVPLVVFMGAWPGAFVWVAGWVHWRVTALPARVVVPVVWVGLDALRGEVVGGGFEWYFVGHPLIASPLASAPAALGGAYLVTLMVVLVTGIALDVLPGSRGCRVRAGVQVGLLCVVWVASGFLRGHFEVQGTVVAAVVQTNVPQDNKIGWTLEAREQDFAEFVRLTRFAAQQNPDLIVWPETMFPGFALDNDGARVLDEAGLGSLNSMREELLVLQAEIGIPMLVGATTARNLRVVDEGERFRFESDATYNSAYVIEGGSVRAERYDKVAPTPFGETLPYINNWPWLKNLVLRIGLGASGMDFGLAAGREARPLEVEVGGKAIEVATPICFESSMSRVCRRIAKAGASTDLLIVMTNDGWFGGANRGREVHLMLARWRCVELGLPMVRSANTGISAAIDDRGRVLGRVEPDTSGVLQVPVQAGRAWTLYGVIGNAVGWAGLAGLVGLVVAGTVRAKNDRRVSGKGAGA